MRDLRWPLRCSLYAGGLVLVQAALGGLTVEKNLDEELVAAHLCLAMLLLGLLLWMWHMAGTSSASRPGVPAKGSKRMALNGRGFSVLATVASVLLLGAIVAGGYIAGTEKEGAGGPEVVNGAHLACGEQFPKCLDRAFPFGEARLVDIHLTHRVLVYLATAAILLLLGLAAARGVRSRLILAGAALLVAQLALGALNVWLGKHATLVVAHLTVATLLWGTVLLIGMRFAWASEPAGEAATGGAQGAAPSARHVPGAPAA